MNIEDLTKRAKQCYSRGCYQDAAEMYTAIARAYIAQENAPDAAQAFNAAAGAFIMNSHLSTMPNEKNNAMARGLSSHDAAIAVYKAVGDFARAGKQAAAAAAVCLADCNVLGAENFYAIAAHMYGAANLTMQATQCARDAQSMQLIRAQQAPHSRV